MPTLTVTDARKNLFGLIDDVAEEHRGYCIVGKRNQAVLISMEDWNAKFRRNVRRDAEHEKAWAADGWNLIVVWECALKTEKEREKTFAFILRHLERWAR